MKKILSYLPFAGALSMNILTLFMFALTGDTSMVVLLPFCFALLLITLENIVE